MTQQKTSALTSSTLTNLLSPSAQSDLVNSARWHRLSPLLHWIHQQEGQVSEVPRSDFVMSKFRNGVLHNQLEELLSAFGELRALVLKGGHLAFHIYDDSALRPMSDLDILVEPSLVQQASLILEGLGYHPKPNTLSSFHQAFERTQTEAPIELHWSYDLLCGSCRKLSAEVLFADSHLVSFGRAQGYVLEPEMLFLSLCAHLARSGFHVPLMNLVDLVVCMEESNPLDWELIQKKAEELGLETAIALSLDVLEEAGLRTGHRTPWNQVPPKATLEALHRMQNFQSSDSVDGESFRLKLSLMFRGRKLPGLKRFFQMLGERLRFTLRKSSRRRLERAQVLDDLLFQKRADQLPQFLSTQTEARILKALVNFGFKLLGLARCMHLLQGVPSLSLRKDCQLEDILWSVADAGLARANHPDPHLSAATAFLMLQWRGRDCQLHFTDARAWIMDGSRRLDVWTQVA